MTSSEVVKQVTKIKDPKRVEASTKGYKKHLKKLEEEIRNSITSVTSGTVISDDGTNDGIVNESLTTKPVE